MNPQGTKPALVQKVRTFADDVRRAKAGGGVALPTPKKDASPIPTVPTSHGVLQSPSELPKDFGVQKSPPVIVRIEPLETSHLADEKKPLDIRQEASGHSAQEGIIITDTRRKRWTLGKALGQSLTAWFDQQKTGIAERADRKDPEPNVPPVETRAKVVRAARQKSALAPRDDRHAVVEKLRTFARDAERVVSTSSTTPHIPIVEKVVPRWSSATDDRALATIGVQNTTKETPVEIKQARKTIRPGETPSQPTKSLTKDVAPTAERGLPERLFVAREEKSVPRSTTHTPAQYGMTDDIAPLATNERMGEMQPVEEPDRASPIDHDTDATDARHRAIAQLLMMRAHPTEQAAPPTPSRDIAFTPPTFATKETANFRTYRDDAIHDVEQHKRSVPNIAAAEVVRRTAQEQPRASRAAAPSPARPFILAGIIMIAIIVVGGFGAFFYIRQSKQENTTAVSIPTFIALDAQKSVAFSTNRATLLDTLNAAVHAAGAGVTQIYPTKTVTPVAGTSAQRSGGAVTTSDFMYVLDPRAPGSFIRNLSEEMMFGAHTGTEGTSPFFIFKTKQFDTAFAGMIEWEQYMSADLTPLFGTLVTRTKDTTLRTVDQTKNATFVDETLRNVDVRILYDETGKERLLYAFINKNTIVITTSSAALIELIGRLQ